MVKGDMLMKPKVYIFPLFVAQTSHTYVPTSVSNAIRLQSRNESFPSTQDLERQTEGRHHMFTSFSDNMKLMGL